MTAQASCQGCGCGVVTGNLACRPGGHGFQISTGWYWTALLNYWWDWAPGKSRWLVWYWPHPPLSVTWYIKYGCWHITHTKEWRGSLLSLPRRGFWNKPSNSENPHRLTIIGHSIHLLVYVGGGIMLWSWLVVWEAQRLKGSFHCSRVSDTRRLWIWSCHRWILIDILSSCVALVCNL